MTRRAAALCLLLSLFLGAAPARGLERVDLALVLAVDASGSIDEGEFELQRAGYAAAFRHPRVLDAIAAGSAGAIAVTYVQWSDARSQEQLIGWTLLRGPESAGAFADRLARLGRRVPDGSTSISGAIDFSARLLAGAGFEARRRVIDISGDGSNNSGRLAAFARDEAAAAGITINGLVILGEEPMLDRYYRENVIGGPGAFLTTVTGFADFATAIIGKLVHEIAALPAEQGPAE
jgi:uncharacterized protein DUF1194